MSHEYRMEQLRAAIAAARKNFKKDANFFCRGLDIRVAQIMHTGVRRSCFGCNFLVMCIKTLRVQVVAERICENEPTGGVLLGGIYPVLPKITGL